MKNGNRFVGLYNDLCSVLRKRTELDESVPFSKLLKTASTSDPTIRRWQSFLQDMGQLRNAIVHDKKYPLELIADPRQETIDRFDKAVQEIKSPARIYPKFGSEIVPFREDARLGDVLHHMQKNDYSQVVVYINKEHHLLSSEGIVRWLSSARELGLADIENTVVEEACQYENTEEHLFMNRNMPIDSVLEEFEKTITKGKPRLHAILITNSGKPSEKPLGIITPWDLVQYVSNNDLA